MELIKLKSTSSTEDYVRKILKKYQPYRTNFAVIAESQKKGRGTKGRAFSSEKGGIYFSAVLFHTGLKGNEAFTVNQKISVAVVKTLKAFGVEATIKWPNDIFVGDKKICGMLIENSFVGDYIDYTVLGLGLNVNNALPDDLNGIATTLKLVLGRETDLEAVLATLLYNIETCKEVGLYARYSLVLGKNIKVVKPDGTTYTAIAKEILSDGRLLTGDGEKLSAAEVSLRL